MRFTTEITLTGPWRQPAQMLAAEEYDGHSSVHDDTTAAALGLAGAPIEAPTHFSQLDPLAVLAWDQVWFESGCVSAHFRTMVVEGEEVQASLTVRPGEIASIEAHKADGTPVLTGTASVGPVHGVSELERRLASTGDPGPRYILDRLEVGMSADGGVASVDFDESNGPAYPFTLNEKLTRITEPHPWYSADGGPGSPWGRAILPFEMVSVLTNKSPVPWPVRTPSLGLFLDLEIRLLDGPVFVGREYALHQEIVGLGQSRRTESYWTRTTITDAETSRATAQVLLHSGVFKESYPGYPEHPDVARAT